MKPYYRIGAIVVLIAALVASTFYITDALAFVLMLGLANIVGLWILGRGDLMLVYLFIFLGGVLSEVVMIYRGVWNYTQVHTIGYPIWLPFFWFSGAVFVGIMIALLRSGVLQKALEGEKEEDLTF